MGKSKIDYTVLDSTQNGICKGIEDLSSNQKHVDSCEKDMGAWVTLNLMRWMCMGCASGVRLMNSQISVEPRKGVSVTRSIHVRFERRDPVGKSFASAISIMV